MMRLEDLQQNAAIRGIVPDVLVTVVNVLWYGSEALELTYKTPTGKVASELLYRHDEPRLEVVEEGRPWSFDGDGALFRLVSEAQRIRLARALEQGFGLAGESPDALWLSRIESAQMSNPRDGVLQYLAGMVCMRLNLWGKAQQLLKQSLLTLHQSELTRDTWLAIANMAELRQDAQGAADAYREAAKR